MARLEGEKKSPLPILIGLALVALLAVGGYYMYQNRGADSVAVAPGEVNVVDNAPGNVASGGDLDAERNGNTVTVTGGTEGSETADAVGGSQGSAGGTAATDASGTATDGSATGSGGAGNAAGPDASVSSDAGATPSATGASAAGGASSSRTSDETNAGRERSKTITNNKTGTTVTYSKKVQQDGSVSREKTQSGGAASGNSSSP